MAGLFGRKEPPVVELTPEEAYCTILSLAIETDGSITAEEQERFMDYLESSEVLADRRGSLGTLVKTAHDVASRLGEMQALELAGGALPSTLHHSAYRAAAEMTHSDQEQDEVEDSFLEMLRLSLGLPRKEAKLILRDVRAAQP